MNKFLRLGLAAAAVAIGVSVGVALVRWARNLITRALPGIRRGVLFLIKNAAAVMAYAYGSTSGNDLRYVGEMAVDQNEVPEEVVVGLQRAQLIRENIYV